MKQFNQRSKEILDPLFINKKYQEFAEKKINEYLKIANNIRFYKRVLNFLFQKQFFKKIYNKQDCLRLLNIIECEAHRELFIAGLKINIKKKK